MARGFAAALQSELTTYSNQDECLSVDTSWEECLQIIENHEWLTSSTIPGKPLSVSNANYGNELFEVISASPELPRTPEPLDTCISSAAKMTTSFADVVQQIACSGFEHPPSPAASEKHTGNAYATHTIVQSTKSAQDLPTETERPKILAEEPGGGPSETAVVSVKGSAEDSDIASHDTAHLINEYASLFPRDKSMHMAKSVQHAQATETNAGVADTEYPPTPALSTSELPALDDICQSNRATECEETQLVQIETLSAVVTKPLLVHERSRFREAAAVDVGEAIAVHYPTPPSLCLANSRLISPSPQVTTASEASHIPSEIAPEPSTSSTSPASYTPVLQDIDMTLLVSSLSALSIPQRFTQGLKRPSITAKTDAIEEPLAKRRRVQRDVSTAELNRGEVAVFVETEFDNEAVEGENMGGGQNVISEEQVMIPHDSRFVVADTTTYELRPYHLSNDTANDVEMHTPVPDGAISHEQDSTHTKQVYEPTAENQAMRCKRSSTHDEQQVVVPDHGTRNSIESAMPTRTVAELDETLPLTKNTKNTTEVHSVVPDKKKSEDSSEHEQQKTVPDENSDSEARPDIAAESEEINLTTTTGNDTQMHNLAPDEAIRREQFISSQQQCRSDGSPAIETTVESRAIAAPLEPKDQPDQAIENDAKIHTPIPNFAGDQATPPQEALDSQLLDDLASWDAAVKDLDNFLLSTENYDVEMQDVALDTSMGGERDTVLTRHAIVPDEHPSTPAQDTTTDLQPTPPSPLNLRVNPPSYTPANHNATTPHTERTSAPSPSTDSAALAIKTPKTPAPAPTEETEPHTPLAANPPRFKDAEQATAPASEAKLVDCTTEDIQAFQRTGAVAENTVFDALRASTALVDGEGSEHVELEKGLEDIMVRDDRTVVAGVEGGGGVLSMPVGGYLNVLVWNGARTQHEAARAGDTESHTLRDAVVCASAASAAPADAAAAAAAAADVVDGGKEKDGRCFMINGTADTSEGGHVTSPRGCSADSSDGVLGCTRPGQVVETTGIESGTGCVPPSRIAGAYTQSPSAETQERAATASASPARETAEEGDGLCEDGREKRGVVLGGRAGEYAEISFLASPSSLSSLSSLDEENMGLLFSQSISLTTATTNDSASKHEAEFHYERRATRSSTSRSVSAPLAGMEVGMESTVEVQTVQRCLRRSSRTAGGSSARGEAVVKPECKTISASVSVSAKAKTKTKTKTKTNGRAKSKVEVKVNAKANADAKQTTHAHPNAATQIVCNKKAQQSTIRTQSAAGRGSRLQDGAEGEAEGEVGGEVDGEVDGEADGAEEKGRMGRRLRSAG